MDHFREQRARMSYDLRVASRTDLWTALDSDIRASLMRRVRPTALVPALGWGPLLSPEGLVGDLLEAVNAAELARPQFREVARVAGLIFPGYPGSGKSDRQLQASSGLLFDVLARIVVRLERSAEAGE